MATQNFTFDEGLSVFSVTRAAYLAANPHLARLMAAAMVFRKSPSSSAVETLLLRRALSDSYPNKWEIPGGSVDATDASILAGVARELFEESGLVARHMCSPPILLLPSSIAETDARYRLTEDMRNGLGILPEDEDVDVNADQLTVTFLETRNLWAKATVLVEVESTEGVLLRDDEHAESAWVTEEDVLKGTLPGDEDGGDGKRRMDFVSDGCRRSILDGFRIYNQRSK